MVGVGEGEGGEGRGKVWEEDGDVAVDGGGGVTLKNALLEMGAGAEAGGGYNWCLCFRGG